MARDSALGFVGLGRMGGNLAAQAIDRDIAVVGVDPDQKPDLEDQGATVYGAGEYEALRDDLDPPRVVFIALPAGSLIDTELESMAAVFEAGDVLIDGGNSFWRDSIDRERRLREEDIYYLDCGSSGGPFRAREGACFMVGGRTEGYEIAEPLLDALSVDGGLIHTGPPGSGHFTKLVHNGIEFGMLQSIAEGVELLESGQFDLDLQAVFENWSNGSVIESWLVELMAMGLARKGQFAETTPPLEEIPNYVEDTGEVNWLIEEAIKGEVPAPVITQSIIELFKSRGHQQYTYRAIALMRHGFGGHPFGQHEATATERQHGRVSGSSRRELYETDQKESLSGDDSV